MSMGERTLRNKMARIVYCLFKGLHVSVWYYFLPFSCIFLSYVVPHKMGQNPEDPVVE